MDERELVLYEERGGVGILTINRPEVLNAMNTAVMTRLETVIDALNFNTIRCIVITGAGKKSFVAGADIKEMLNFDCREAYQFSIRGNRVFRKLETLPVPVIAAVNGYALGAGCELAAACDLRIASDTASFGQPEVTLGITPGFGGTQRLARLIGTQNAKDMIFSARRVSAFEAHSMGLISQTYPADRLISRAIETAEQIAKNVPFAVRACKAAINEGMHSGLEVALGIEAERFSNCFSTEDHKEAMLAFVEKRAPKPFKNR
ncbi:MAG: enoyl-CoA hydratase-related protein [Clostridiaceae bacterium]|nr:enoyl-CoA hydratase-related protein [Clostridiaceae bacterium]